MTTDFNAFRTEEDVVPVSSASECKRRNPAAMFFTGDDPNIVVGGTHPEAVPIPPGFQAEGITGFVEATIGSTEGSGGMSGKTLGIIAGVGGGAAAGLALSQGGGSGTTSTTASSTSTTVAATSSTTTSVTTTVATTSIASTTSNPTTSSTTSVPGNADLALTKSGSTTGGLGQNLNYSITVANLGPSDAAGVRVIDTWTAGMAQFVGSTPIACTPQSPNRVRCDIGSMPAGGNPVTIRLTLNATQSGSLRNDAQVLLNSPNDPVSSNNSQSVITSIALTAGPSVGLSVTYRSSIVVDPGNGRGRGQMVVNGSWFQATDDGGEYLYQAPVREGVNRMETRLHLNPRSSGTWRFDFGASPEFVRGSLRVESGRVLSLDGASIVFAVASEAAPPQFTFEVGEGRRSAPR